MEGMRFLTSAEQVLLTTLLVKLAVMAAAATILVRFHRYRQFLIFEHRPWPDRVTFAVTLGGLLSAGVVARLLLGYNAAVSPTRMPEDRLEVTAGQSLQLQPCWHSRLCA